MLSKPDITELLAGGLTETEIRSRLLDLTPEKLDANAFQRSIAQVKQFCAPDFAKLSELGTDAIDCSGTGGSGRPRFNTSTASAFVLAAAGARVAKFGNRAATSRSGSFDLLGQMKIPEKLDAKTAGHILNAAGLVFIFAPQAYPALAAISGVRAAIGVSTVFNFIGPLLNPVAPAFRVMGVADPLMQQLVSAFVRETASNICALIVRSNCGLDEICPRCGTHVREVRNGKVTERDLAPTFKGGDCKTPSNKHTPEDNLELMLRIFKGEDSTSYEYELLCTNAGAGLFASGKSASVEEGIQQAKELIASGKVDQQLAKVKEAYAKHT
jgi:anthranilate phosphoribosyltransferase